MFLLSAETCVINITKRDDFVPTRFDQIVEKTNQTNSFGYRIFQMSTQGNFDSADKSSVFENSNYRFLSIGIE